MMIFAEKIKDNTACKEFRQFTHAKFGDECDAFEKASLNQFS